MVASVGMHALSGTGSSVSSYSVQRRQRLLPQRPVNIEARKRTDTRTYGWLPQIDTSTESTISDKNHEPIEAQWADFCQLKRIDQDA